MIDPPGDGNPPEQFRGETSRDIYAWIQEARLFIEGTKTFNRDALYVRGAILLRAMRGDGITTGADSAGSGARGTLDGRTRDPEALIANHNSAASSADPLPSQPYDLRTLEYVHNEWEFADMTEPEFDEFLHQLIQHARRAPTPIEAAADPALRTLSQQWREAARILRSNTEMASEPLRSIAASLADERERCAADLDRVCPEIRDAQKHPPTDPV